MTWAGGAYCSPGQSSSSREANLPRVGAGEERRVDIADIEERLKHTDRQVRARALDEAMAACGAGLATCRPPREVANLHCHTIYSYNAYGHTPTSLAWLARREGWYALATVDFDVLDGVAETLEACDRAGVRGAAGLETRTFVAELQDDEINSPGEPGVCYLVGGGYVALPESQEARERLADMKRCAQERNRELVQRINAHLSPVEVHYDRDVLPLTPSGNATERHILVAYDVAARRHFPDREALVAFWADRLGVTPEVAAGAIGDEPAPSDLVRAMLMKKGGVGYVQPGPTTFPPLDDVLGAIVAGGAVPIYPWLDGSSPAEARTEELLSLLIAKGVAGITIIPERNWRIPDAALRARRVEALHSVIALASRLDLPIVIGTEMNKPGQPLLDDWEAEPLRPYRQEFLRGADWLYGHTVLQRSLGLGYQSTWARTHLPGRGERNAFYMRVGREIPPGAGLITRLARVSTAGGPEAVLDRLLAARDRWLIRPWD